MKLLNDTEFRRTLRGFDIYTGCRMICDYCEATTAPLCIFGSDVISTGGLEGVVPIEDEIVYLCPNCDPYGSQEKDDITMHVLEELARAKVRKVMLLTKDGCRAQRDIHFFVRNPEWEIGVSMSYVWNCKAHADIERFAGTLEGRRKLIRDAKCRGAKTFIQIWPILDIEQAVETVQVMRKFTTRFEIGLPVETPFMSDTLRQSIQQVTRNTNWPYFKERILELAEGHSEVVFGASMDANKQEEAQ